MTKKAKHKRGPAEGLSPTDESWLKVKEAIASEIVSKLPRTLPLDDVPARLSIPAAAVRRGVAEGSIVTTVIGADIHMVCEASHYFLQKQSDIRLPLPESLRPAHP